VKKLVAVTVGALTVALLALWLAPASSQPSPRRVSMQLFDSDKTGFSKDIQEDGQGFGAGDENVSIDPALDPDSCKHVGTLMSQGTVLKRLGKRNGLFLFHGVLRLPRGRLAFEWGGRFSEFSKTVEVPITGGSGAFAGATGQATATHTHRCGDPGTLITLDVLSVR
jgi:hypothetical protein